MQNKRLASILTFLTVALIVLAGCGPRASGGDLAASAAADDIVVDLPALYIDFDGDGQASLGGTSIAELGAIAGQDLSTISMPPEQIDFLTASGVQHIHVDNTQEGILIYVNGEPIPSLAWDGESLVTTANTLETLGAGVALLDKVLPLILNMGIGVVLRFPVAEGAEVEPLVVVDSETAANARAAQEEFLAAVGSPPVIQLAVSYAPDGSWSLANLTRDELSQYGVPVDMLDLDAALIQSMSDAGVDTLAIATGPEGIGLEINGQGLPYINWADGRVNNVINLAMKLGLLEGLTGGADVSAIIDTVQSLLPAIQASDISLNVIFE